jgi:hypothetical protein
MLYWIGSPEKKGKITDSMLAASVSPFRFLVLDPQMIRISTKPDVEGVKSLFDSALSAT